MDPWRGDVRDGRVYGGGGGGMKGGLAAAIVAVETLIESGIRLPGALEISGTVDEESGGYGGVAWLAGKGFFSRPGSTTSSSPSRSTLIAYASAIAACGGPRSRPWGGSRTARCRFWATAPCATWGR